MKNKLFALFFLFVILSACERKTEILVAQSVPDTETFSLFDVLDAVYGSHASGNLADAFAFSDAAKFDPNYGSKTMSPQTLLGFRNYGAVPAIPVATDATNNSCSSFTANWEASSRAIGYYLFVSLYSNFSSYVTGYQQLDVGNVVSYPVTGLTANTAYYFRIMAYNGSGISYASNIISIITLRVYDDWHMPTEEDLDAMYNNLKVNGIGGFSNAYYWSNVECVAGSYNAHGFTNNSVYCRDAGNFYKVRPVRYFESYTVYNLGDEGPAGGWIFYKEESPFGYFGYWECTSVAYEETNYAGCVYFGEVGIGGECYCNDLVVCH